MTRMTLTTDTGWFVYILLCADGSLYTGCTNNVLHRIQTHNAGKGAKYTLAKLPVILVYQEPAQNRSQAQRREAEIKKLTRTQKLSLISTYSDAY